MCCLFDFHSKLYDIVIEKKPVYGYEREFYPLDWLKSKINMTLDFYIPDYDIGIECQGRQHFMPVEKFGGEEGFKDTKIRDGIKKKCCNEHGIKLLYFTELKKYNVFNGETLIKAKDKLIENIEKYGRK